MKQREYIKPKMKVKELKITLLNTISGEGYGNEGEDISNAKAFDSFMDEYTNLMKTIE